MEKLVTVAIPAYNGEEFIKYAIESIIRQTYKVDEILIIDNKSTDKTVDIVKNVIKNNYDSNIRLLLNKEHCNYDINWNKCFENTTTKLLFILHADDMLKPDTIEKQIQFFQEHPEVALVGGGEDIINEGGELIIKKKSSKKTDIYKAGKIYEFVSNTGSYIPPSSVMFNMEKIRQVGFFDNDVMATDELYWPKVLSRFPIAIIGESLINRRHHKNQDEYSKFISKSNYVIEACYTQIKNIPKYEKCPKNRKKIIKLIKKKNARNGLRIAFTVLRKNQYKLFFKYFFFAIKQFPPVIFSKSFLRLIYHTIFSMK